MSTPEVKAKAGAAPPNPGSDETASKKKLDEELLKTFAKEGLDQSRYFGNLRGLVSWVPTLAILLTADRLSENKVVWLILTIPQWAVVAVFVLVFFAQYSLQKHQLQGIKTANFAYRQLTGNFKAGESSKELSSYGAFTVGFKYEWNNWIKPDFPSVALAIFYIVVLGAYIASSL